MYNVVQVVHYGCSWCLMAAGGHDGTMLFRWRIVAAAGAWWLQLVHDGCSWCMMRPWCQLVLCRMFVVGGSNVRLYSGIVCRFWKQELNYMHEDHVLCVIVCCVGVVLIW